MHLSANVQRTNYVMDIPDGLASLMFIYYQLVNENGNRQGCGEQICNRNLPTTRPTQRNAEREDRPGLARLLPSEQETGSDFSR
jgi:hypothetical protein